MLVSRVLLTVVASTFVCERGTMEPSEIAGLTQKAALTRQRILDTALQLFATNGYEKTTMRDIAGVYRRGRARRCGSVRARWPR